MRLPALITALLLLSACSPSRPSLRVADDLTHHYLGRGANEFFFDHGPPASQYATDSGKVYRWASTELPPGESALPALRIADDNAEMVETYRGVIQTHYCELRIYTDAQDVIQRIAVAVDSEGKFTASRCDEIFF